MAVSTHPLRGFRLFALAALVFFLAQAPLSAARLKVQVFDVGQGDAILVTCPEGKHQLLIDSGCNKYPRSQENFRRELTTALQADPNLTLEIAVATHPHSDHIGGMLWTLNTFKVGTYIDGGRAHDTVTYSKLQKVRVTKTKNNQLRYLNGTEISGQEVTFCSEMTVKIITPAAQAPDLDHPNDRSVGIWLDYRGKRFLFVGDMEEHAEEAWHERLSPELRQLANVDVLKVGHHGSDTSSSAGFVQMVSPALALVSCGARDVGTNSGYKHPRFSTVQVYADWFASHPPPLSPGAGQLLSYNATTKKWINAPRPPGIWFTVLDGTITVETDGQQFFVSKTK